MLIENGISERSLRPPREIYQNKATRRNYVCEAYVRWLEDEHERHLSACQCIKDQKHDDETPNL